MRAIVGNAVNANAGPTNGWIVGHMHEGLAGTNILEIKRWYYPEPFDYGWKKFQGTEYFSVYGGKLRVDLEYADGTSESVEVSCQNGGHIIIPPGTKKRVVVLAAPAFGDTVRWPSYPGVQKIIEPGK